MSVSRRRQRRGAGIEFERADGEHGRPGRRATPDERAQARQEHHERERLGEEVVGAGVERLGLVVLAVLGGEDQDRCPHALVAQGAAHPVAVHPGQEHVEDDGVVRALAGAPEAVGAVVGHVDVEALGDQAVGDRRREQFLVFDHQHAHRRIVPVREPVRGTGAQGSLRRANPE